MHPETRYARSGDVHVAYQVIGQGPVDIIFLQGFISHLEVQWEDSGMAHLCHRLSGFSRLILFDKRGSGLSDRISNMPDLQTRMDDVRAVMDAVGSRRAVLIGASEGAPMAILFAATYPDRVRALVLYGAYAHFHTWVQSPEQVRSFVADAERAWGTGESLHHFAPGLVGNERFKAWWARFERFAASPAAVVALAEMNSAIDVRHVLPAVRVPCLVVHRRDDVRVAVAAGRYLAQHIPKAVYVELPGTDHPIWIGDTDRVVDEVESFVTGIRPHLAPERVLATALAINPIHPNLPDKSDPDSGAADILQQFGVLARAEIDRYKGRLARFDAAGLLAVFDGPVRALRCSEAIRNAAERIDVATRYGLHTGEVAFRKDGAEGLVLDIAMRIAALGCRGDILLSQVVCDLVVGSDLVFAKRSCLSADELPATVHVHALVTSRDAETIPRQGPAPIESGGLSPREREIVAHLARGTTNAAIARALALSEHTVKRHVANILAKLDLPNRSAVAAFATKYGLL